MTKMKHNETLFIQNSFIGLDHYPLCCSVFNKNIVWLHNISREWKNDRFLKQLG